MHCRSLELMPGESCSGCCRLELPAFIGCGTELLSHSRSGSTNLLLPLDLSAWKYFSKSQKAALWPGEGLLQEVGLETLSVLPFLTIS